MKKKTRRTNKDKREAVLKLLKELHINKGNWSNCKIAAEARVSESLVRLIKSQMGYKSTSQVTKSIDGRSINTSKIGSGTKSHKKKKIHQQRIAKSKKEKLDLIDQGTNLETMIHKCPVCKNHFVGH